MQTHAASTRENKNQHVAYAVSQKKNNPDLDLSFADNRPETIAQRKLQDMANNSLQLKKDAPAHSPGTGEVVQLKGKYKQFAITTKQELLDWINGEEGWTPGDLEEVIRDWNAEKTDKIAFGELGGTGADDYIMEDDIAFQHVTEKKEEPENVPDSPVVPRALRKPENYQVVKEGWSDKKAMNNHCYTYCGNDQMILVNAAEKLGLNPPMLGHGSDSGVGGTAKDEILWKQFQEYMKWYFADNGYEGRTLSAIAKSINKK